MPRNEERQGDPKFHPPVSIYDPNTKKLLGTVSHPKTKVDPNLAMDGARALETVRKFKEQDAARTVEPKKLGVTPQFAAQRMLTEYNDYARDAGKRRVRSFEELEAVSSADPKDELAKSLLVRRAMETLPSSTDKLLAGIIAKRNATDPSRGYAPRRGAVENAVRNNPFGNNPIIAEGMRQDLYNARYEQRMQNAENRSSQMAQQQQPSQTSSPDAPTTTPDLPGSRPDYNSARKRKRNLDSLRRV